MFPTAAAAAAGQAAAPRRSSREGAMSVFQPDTESGKRTTTNDVPTFQVVRKGYDREQVDAYVPKLLARLERAEQARAALQREVVSLQEKVPPTFEELGDDAATVLAEAGGSPPPLGRQAQRARRAAA